MEHLMPTEVTITISSTDVGSQRVGGLSGDSLDAAPSPLPIEALGSPLEAAARLEEVLEEAPAPLAVHEILGASAAHDDAPEPSPLASLAAGSDNGTPVPAPLEDIQPQGKKRR